MHSKFNRRELLQILTLGTVYPSISSSQELMQDAYASFMGVKISTAVKREVFNAAIKGGAYKKDFDPKELEEKMEFREDKFPGGITNVVFHYMPDGRLIQAVAKIPMHGFGEKRAAREARYASVFNSLVEKYGDPSRVADNKTEFGVYPRYTWLFSDRSAIVLLHKSPVYGMDLTYANIDLFKVNKSTIITTKKGNL